MWAVRVALLDRWWQDAAEALVACMGQRETCTVWVQALNISWYWPEHVGMTSQ